MDLALRPWFGSLLDPSVLMVALRGVDALGPPQRNTDDPLDVGAFPGAEEGRIWCISAYCTLAPHTGVLKEVGRVCGILWYGCGNGRVLRDVAGHGELDGSFDVVPPRVMPRREPNRLCDGEDLLERVEEVVASSGLVYRTQSHRRRGRKQCPGCGVSRGSECGELGCSRTWRGALVRRSFAFSGLFESRHAFADFDVDPAIGS
jgi:hypothetical protein